MSAVLAGVGPAPHPVSFDHPRSKDRFFKKKASESFPVCYLVFAKKTKNKTGINRMLLKTILNRCHKFKSFIYGQTYFTEHNGNQCIDIEIMPRKNSKIICSGCGAVAPGYDTKNRERRFEFIPILGYPVFFLYFMRRVNCQACGVTVEELP